MTKSIPPWTKLSNEPLLDWRICDLGLSIQGTALESCIAQLNEELTQKHISFKPHCFLADEWFCPEGVPAIGIPFYLAHARLRALEQSIMLEVEGGTQYSCMRLLRHETGHAICYAYGFQKSLKWRRIFGDSSVEYPDTYRPRPYSRNFVRHLENWYAQAHPDEDFAETFAVWLTPRHDWERRYRGWNALEKLRFVDGLMQKVACREPRVKKGALISEARKLRSRLSTYYRRKRRQYEEDYPDFFDRDLLTIFTSKSEPASASASAFMRAHDGLIRNAVSHWTRERKYTIDRLQKRLLRRCDDLGLFVHRSDEETLAQIIAYLTSSVTHYLFTGTFRRRV